MKNFHIDPDQWTLYFLSVVFVGVGLLVLFFLGQNDTLRCTRTGGTQVHCTLTTTWMNISRLKEVTFSSLISANTEENCDEDGCTYRVMLVTSSGGLPLTNVYSSGYESKQKMVDQINSYLRTSDQRSLEIESSSGLWIVLPVFFILVGIGLGVKEFIKSL
jgi:hypothetical protein